MIAGSEPPEGHRRLHAVGEIERGLDADQRLRLAERARQGSNTERRAPIMAETPKPQRQAQQPQTHTRHKHQQYPGMKWKQRYQRIHTAGLCADDRRGAARRGEAHSLPGLEQRQEQAGRQQCLPVGKHDPRLLQAQHRRSQPAHRDHQRHLDAVRQEISQPPRGTHSASSIVRAIFSSSFFDNRRSLIRWTSSGSAEPLNTRSTNSRTMALITSLRGRVAW